MKSQRHPRLRTQREWPDTTTIRSFQWVADVLAEHYDEVVDLLEAGAAETELRLPVVGGRIRPLGEQARLDDTGYGALHIGENRLPVRLTADRTVHVGFRGESTCTVIDLMSRLLKATSEVADPLALTGDLYRRLKTPTRPDIENVSACVVCSASPRAGAPLARCVSCGTIYRPGADDQRWRPVYCDDSGDYFQGIDSAADAPAGHGYEDYEEWSRIILGAGHFDERARWIESVTGIREGTMLDVGCAIGDMSGAMSRRGWSAAGVDLSGYCLAKATRYHPDCQFAQGAVQDVKDRYDVITYLDVFEHLADPAGELGSVAARLRPGGFLVLELPNQDSAEAALLEGDYLFAEHQVFYGPAQIRRLLERCGFRVRAISTAHDVYFRIDRIVGPALAERLISDDRGERLIVAAQVR